MTTANDSDAADLVAALPAPGTIADPYPLYDALRPQTPVYGYQDYPPGTVPGQDEPVTAWVLMKYDEVAQAARDHDTFSSRDPLQEQSSAPTLMLVNHDNPEHDRLRRLVSVAFSRREVSELKHGSWTPCMNCSTRSATTKSKWFRKSPRCCPRAS